MRIHFKDKKPVKTRFSKPSSPIECAQLDEMKRAKIIYEVERPTQYCASFFLVAKPSRKTRPITNYKALSKKMDPPKFYLPSLYQLVENLEWSGKLHYLSLDLRQAFYNIPLHKASQFVTCFRAGGRFWQYNVLPFGLGLAPFVCQTFTQAICDFALREGIQIAKGHIDDMLFADQNPVLLKTVVDRIVEKLSRIRWRVNFDKSVLEPTDDIVHLGARWSGDGTVTRTPAASKLVHDLLIELELLPTRAGKRQPYLLC